MRGSDLIFDYIDSLYYKCHIIHLKCGKSYINSPVQIKFKNAITVLVNRYNNKYFEYATTLAVNQDDYPKLGRLQIHVIGKR